MNAKTAKTPLVLDIQSVARLRSWARRNKMTAGDALSLFAERFNQPTKRASSFARGVQPTYEAVAQ